MWHPSFAAQGKDALFLPRILISPGQASCKLWTIFCGLEHEPHSWPSLGCSHAYQRQSDEQGREQSLKASAGSVFLSPVSVWAYRCVG